jgi:hypothetical protein
VDPGRWIRSSDRPNTAERCYISRDFFGSALAVGDLSQSRPFDLAAGVSAE